MTYPQTPPQNILNSCARPPQNSSKRQSDRELAKTGMAVSLGALVMTGLLRTPQARVFHIIAGTAMVGLCLWHSTLYKPNNKR